MVDESLVVEHESETALFHPTFLGLAKSRQSQRQEEKCVFFHSILLCLGKDRDQLVRQFLEHISHPLVVGSGHHDQV